MAEKAKVYFADFRCPSWRENLPQKLARLMMTAGFGDIDMEGKFVAIKMHFGELGCLASIRPQYVKAVADLVKELGGKPFLTDCNTLYPGSRKHALEHLDCANLNGYNTITTGCQIIIGDGLRGTDEVEIPVKNGEYVQNAKIGRAIMDADVFISLAHFKGHEMTGFGGAVKNIGMGCGSRAGKMRQHRPYSRRFVQGLRPLHRRLRLRRHSHGAVGRQRKTGLQDGRICSGRLPGPSVLPYQPGHGHFAELRLPWRKRCARTAEYWHVRFLRPGCPRPGLRRRLLKGHAAAEQPAVR